MAKVDALVTLALRKVSDHFALLALSAIFIVFFWYITSKPRLPKVPLLKISTLPGAAGTAADIAAFVKNGSEVMQIGYERFSKKGQHFLMATPQETVFVGRPEAIEEIRSAPDEYLNPIAANNEILQLRHTLHPRLEKDKYELEVARRPLMGSLAPGLPMVIDEAQKAFHDKVGEPKEWITLGMYKLGFNIVTRTANRLLFGSKLCNDPTFLQLSIDFSETMFGGANRVRNLPEFLKPVVMYFKTSLYRDVATAQKCLAPILNERLSVIRAHEAAGTMEQWQKEKPMDAIQWVLDLTPPEKRDVKMLVYRMMHVNISAVHTSSVTWIDTMYDLAARPEIHNILREEIVRVFQEEGGAWRKQGLTKLVKLDSFMRESLRFKPLFAGQLDRIVVKDYTMKDSTVLPKGTYITVPSFAMYHDKDNYPNPEVFDPWRFSKMRTQPGHETLHSFVQTDPKFLHFGHGKHACPGRFFASNEIKVLLIYTLMNYDIKLPDGTKQLPSLWLSKSRIPSPTGQVCWKYRPGNERYSNAVGF